MDDAPVSLGERLDVVAFACAAATAVILVTNLFWALTLDVVSGAANSPLHQRIGQATQPAGVTLALVVLVGAASLAVRRWLGGDAGPTDRLARFVVLMAGLVAALAVVSLFSDVLAHDRSWGWQVQVMGEQLAAAAIALSAWWLVSPPRRWAGGDRG